MLRPLILMQRSLGIVRLDKPGTSLPWVSRGRSATYAIRRGRSLASGRRCRGGGRRNIAAVGESGRARPIFPRRFLAPRGGTRVAVSGRGAVEI